VAVNTLVIFQIFYLFNSRYINASIFNWEGFTGNRYVLYATSILVLFQLGFTYLPFMQTLFGTVAINLNSWIFIVLAASSVLFLVEIEKLIVRNISLRKPGMQNGI
jgi:magnesium-transporting ATPase (P-type)